MVLLLFPFYQKDDWTAVPQFGGWDKKTATPDYSMVFSRARANRKYQKSGVRPASLSNESDLLTHRHYDDDEPVTVYLSSDNLAVLILETIFLV
jgi:Cleavage site for pathogenic type III effector avirulence factor Avr